MNTDISNMFSMAAHNLAEGKSSSHYSESALNYRNRKGANYFDLATLDRERRVLDNEYEDINKDLLNRDSTSPRLRMTDEVVDGHIRAVHFFRMSDIYKSFGIVDDTAPVAAASMILCHIVTTDGLLFTGESSCMDIRTYDPNVTEWAYKQAREKLYEFLAMKYKSEYFRERAGL